MKNKRLTNKARFRRLAHAALLVGLFFILQLHIVTLQLTAWTQMTIDYTVDHSFAEAISETFNGPPCELCLAIDATQQDTEQQDILLPVQMTFVLPAPDHLQPRRQTDSLPRPKNTFFLSRLLIPQADRPG